MRINGRIYEMIRALIEGRRSYDLYHSALEVTVPEARFVIENAWPIPDSNPQARGVTVEGPVGAHYLGRFRAFRYEVRRWCEGTIPDVAEAVASPVRVVEGEYDARRVLALAAEVPQMVWGRDELRVGEMWNSNSVIAWLLARAGLPAAEIKPPPRGRAPGWITGVVAAGRTAERELAEPA